MKRFWVLVLWAAAAAAQVVPGIYVVELAGEPAAEALARTGRREAADVRRVQIASEQQRLRSALAGRRAEVLAAMDTVLNGLVVRLPDDNAAALSSLPGVRKVYAVHEVRLELNRALPLHKVPEAWEQLGGSERAGLGAKIGIVDTGLDNDHAGFQDSSLQPPEGFPKVGKESDLAFTNSKIIVARSYEELIDPTVQSTPRDLVGHGTAVAMAAAGVPHSGTWGDISGVAPKAFLGNYKVFTGSRGGRTRSDVIVRALDDAVRDGMDIINLSLGSIPAPRPEDDVLVRAVERAADAGVLVVKSAGNVGPDPNTMSSPSAAPSVLSVGASWNDRLLAATVVLGESSSYFSVPGTGTIPRQPITAPMLDVEKLDSNGMACGGLPADSLSGRIAFILRGVCTFEEKLLAAERAGAVGAVIYTDTRPVALMAVGTAMLPAMMITNEDGLTVKAQLGANPGQTAVLNFLVDFPVDPNRVASFSSRGPDESGGIKPDLVAVGVELSTATQKTTADGELYSPRGYEVLDGTSFSSPLAAGAAAVLKAARRSLTVRQLRSLLINNGTRLVLASGGVAPVQHTGGGVLNLAGALAGTLAFAPAALSFGAGGSTLEFVRQVQVTNVGAAAATYNVAVAPAVEGPAPEVSPSSFPLEPGASRTIDVRWMASGLQPGEYQGTLRLREAATEKESQVPYWYAVRSTEPRNLTVLSAPAEGAPESNVTVYLRVSDVTGLSLFDPEPTAAVVSGAGRVRSVDSVDFVFPGVWRVQLQLGPDPRNNVFRFEAGTLNRQITIRGVDNAN